jgi:hypothetical protein
MGSQMVREISYNGFCLLGGLSNPRLSHTYDSRFNWHRYWIAC